MDSVVQASRIRMVEGVPYKLKAWWEKFSFCEKLAIAKNLGFLVKLFMIAPDKHLIRALIPFWDPDHVVFAFKDFELTPTLEEIHYFTDLKYQNLSQIIPRSQSGGKFLRYLGLKYTNKLGCFKHNWVSLEYLYERYGCLDGYQVFRKEFSCAVDHWHARRHFVFAVALLGTLVFPREEGKISTCIGHVVKKLFEGDDGKEYTLVPMILAEIFRALEKCKRKETYFFEGCNLLLQLCAMEHFYQRDNMVHVCHSNANHIVSFYDRVKRFVSPTTTKDWLKFLGSRASDQIQWKYLLLSRHIAYIRSKRLYYIELIGLEGLQPYAPVHVLQQFGQTQIIHLRANMKVSEITFGPDFIVPRTKNILWAWDNIITIEIKRGPAEKVPEYRVWFQENRNGISQGDKQGFEDVEMTIWARYTHLGTRIVTPEIWTQMESIMRYLEHREGGPSNVITPSPPPPPS